MHLSKGAFFDLSPPRKPSVHLCVLSATCFMHWNNRSRFKSVYLQKQPPSIVASKTPPPPASVYPGVVWGDCCMAGDSLLCHCNEAKPGPEVSAAVWFPETLCKLKPLPEIPPSHISLSAFSHTLRLSSPSECTQALRLAFHPSFLLLYKTLVHKGTLPRLELCAVAKTETAAGCGESITPHRHSVCEILK